MKAAFLFFVLLTTCALSFGQVLIGDSKASVKRQLKSGFKPAKGTESETDTSYTYLLHDGTKSPMDIYCSFDGKGNCVSQKMVFSCDSCYHSFLKEVLAIKRYKWQLVANNRYVSEASKHLLISYNNSAHYFIIGLDSWTDDEYKRLLNSFN